MALTGGSVDSLVGPVPDAGERGDPLDYKRVVCQIQSGRHVFVYPKDRATASIAPAP